MKIYSFESGEKIKDILHTDLIETLYLLIWEKASNENYIIMCCYEKILIYNLLNGELYADLSTDIKESCGDYYFSGFISYNNKYLYTSSSEGYINIWDLNQKSLIKTILLQSSSLYKIIPWSVYINYSMDKDDLKLYRNINNYILVCDKNKLGIINLNIIFRNEIDYNEVTNKIYDEDEEIFYKHNVIGLFKNKDNQHIKMIKKITHPLYQDSILCSDENQNIDLWINNPPIMINIFNE